MNRRTFVEWASVACFGATGTGASPSERGVEQRTDDGMVSFRSGDVTVQGYLARPTNVVRQRAVVLLHGGVGVPEAPRDTARELARNGFTCLVYSRFSRWPSIRLEDVQESDRTGKPLHGVASQSGTSVRLEVQDAQACIDYLIHEKLAIAEGVGLVGFCGGGYVALLLSTQSKNVRAVVAFYAPPVMMGQFQNPTDPKPSLMDRVAQIRVPVQGHYGADDPTPGLSIPAVRDFERALKSQGTSVAMYIYEGASHGFFLDSTGPMYNAEASRLAMSRMIAFLERRLS